MINKDIRLDFWDCESVVEITSDEGSGTIILSITELEVDDERTTPESTFYKDRSTTEIYLSNKEVESIIQALEQSLIEDDE